MRILIATLITVISITNAFAQRALYDEVKYFDIKTPNQVLDNSIQTYKVFVETPYTLTAEDVEAKAQADFEQEKANYATLVKESEDEFQDRLANHDDEVAEAERRYDKEMADFKSLTLLERLALTEQGKKPKLRIPSKPRYVKPSEPRYQKPNLADQLIFDNQVLADIIEVYGFEKGGEDLVFAINVTRMQFQDNGGKTYYNQPTTLQVIQGSETIHEKSFDDEFKYLTSSSSNSLNLDRYEKNNVNKIMKKIGKYINKEFGYTPIASSIKIGYPKNKDREYDALENAKIKAVSAYRKMNKNAGMETRKRAIAELQKARTVWLEELTKIDYKDKKAVMNKKVAKIIFFNLLKVDISLKDKTKAEETVNAIQERRIDLDLSYDEEARITRLEEQV